jgi:hypothetical protein
VADAVIEALISTSLIDHDECHRAIRRTGGTKPHITHPRNVLAVSPGPLAMLLQVVALNLPPIEQFEDIRTLPFHEERALVRYGDMAPKLRMWNIPAERCDRHSVARGIRDAHRESHINTCETPAYLASIARSLARCCSDASGAAAMASTQRRVSLSVVCMAFRPSRLTFPVNSACAGITELQ